MTYMAYTTFMKTVNWRERHERDMKDPEYRREWDALGLEFDIIHAIIRKRIKDDMTQAQLAKKMRTGQATISRLETGNYNPSVKFLRRLAKALDAELKISLV